MKPYKILIFLLFVLVLVLVTAFFFPERGINIGGFTLKFHWLPDDVKQQKVKYADISLIIEENRQIIFSDTLPKKNTTQKNSLKTDTVKINTRTLKKRIYHIEYPSDDSTVLFSFFGKLEKSSKKRVRILHYGDSQIEGDRITGYLRNKFQRRFGGSGPGLLPATPGYAESASIIHTASKNWKTYSVYYKKDSVIKPRKFGVMGSFARFTDYLPDSVTNVYSAKKAQAWINFKKSGMAYVSVNRFKKCRVFYGNNIDSIIVKGFVNDSLIWFEEPAKTQNTTIFEWDFLSTPNNFKIEFKGVVSPNVYAIALDAEVGVAVDNLPFRGSSGTEFSKLDFSQFKQMANYLNTGLIILEFGVNVVPYQAKSYKFYERALTREINYLKKVYNNPAVLVIGVSDMAHRNGTYFESYPNIDAVKQAQRNAAKNTGSAFWDLQKAMGGKNSMPEWVFASPPLAQKDFTHFNRKGGHIIAQMLYNAIIDEYNQWQKSKNIR
jgi:hypothetical protein